MADRVLSLCEQIECARGRSAEYHLRRTHVTGRVRQATVALR